MIGASPVYLFREGLDQRPIYHVVNERDWHRTRCGERLWDEPGYSCRATRLRLDHASLFAVPCSVESLRLDGWPICSDGSGVWLGDRADLDATLASLRRRLVTQYQTFLALRRTRRAMGDYQQTELWAS